MRQGQENKKIKEVGKISTILVDSCRKMFEVVCSAAKVVDLRSKDVDLSSSSTLELLFICGVAALRLLPPAHPIGRRRRAQNKKRPTAKLHSLLVLGETLNTRLYFFDGETPAFVLLSLKIQHCLQILII